MATERERQFPFAFPSCACAEFGLRDPATPRNQRPPKLRAAHLIVSFGTLRSLRKIDW